LSDDLTWCIDTISLHQYGDESLHVEVGAIWRRLGKSAEIQSLLREVNNFQLRVRRSRAEGEAGKGRMGWLAMDRVASRPNGPAKRRMAVAE